MEKFRGKVTDIILDGENGIAFKFQSPQTNKEYSALGPCGVTIREGQELELIGYKRFSSDLGEIISFISFKEINTRYMGQNITIHETANRFKPIETEYNGNLFRSRLEARWAVFLYELGVKYIYEYEGFILPGLGNYLPDFFLPDQSTWVEIKPFAYTYKDLNDLMETRAFQKCYALAKNSKDWVFLVAGNPYHDEYRAAAIRPGFDPEIFMGSLGLLPIERENETDEENTANENIPEKKGGLFSFFRTPDPPKIKEKEYEYILYPIEQGKVYAKTERVQDRAFNQARGYRFY